MNDLAADQGIDQLGVLQFLFEEDAVPAAFLDVPAQLDVPVVLFDGRVAVLDRVFCRSPEHAPELTAIQR